MNTYKYINLIVMKRPTQSGLVAVKSQKHNTLFKLCYNEVQVVGI